MKYKTIYADPPWQEIGGGVICRGAQGHYPVMKTADIKKLPVPALAEENCHLYLWVTNNFMPDGLEVVEAWGFRYVTLITWAKDKFGLGQYFRGQTEHCIFAVKGMLPYRTKANGKRGQGTTLIEEPTTLFKAARTEHSQKPEKMREYIEIVSHPPYVELFARKESAGWDCWGNEVQSIPLGNSEDATLLT